MIAEADELVAGALLGMLGLDAREVARTGDVEDLDFWRQRVRGLGDELVDAESTLGTAGDEEGGFVRIEPEMFRGLGAGWEVENFWAGGSSC